MECAFRCSVSLPTHSHARQLLYVLAVTFAGAVISLGGLASVQDLQATHEAQYVPSAGNWRYTWFVLAWEITVLAICAAIICAEQLEQARYTCVGLMSIATLLYIQFSNIFYNESNAWQDDTQKDRLYTGLAGGIITATLNTFCIILLGWKCSGCEHPCACPVKEADPPAAPAAPVQPEVAVAVAQE